MNPGMNPGFDRHIDRWAGLFIRFYPVHTFMSRNMSGTSRGSAFRSLNMSVFFFYSFFLFWEVLWRSEAKDISSFASRGPYPPLAAGDPDAFVGEKCMQQCVPAGSQSAVRWQLFVYVLYIDASAGGRGQPRKPEVSGFWPIETGRQSASARLFIFLLSPSRPTSRPRIILHRILLLTKKYIDECTTFPV